MPMIHNWSENEATRQIEYKWKPNNDWQVFQLTTEKELSNIEEGSITEFITEHYWGYAKVNERKTYEYEVTHPKWLKYNVIDFDISADFGLTYGEEFGFLSKQKPDSVMLAEGSEITVENKRIIIKKSK